ncbi:helix-turn-helix protein [Murinocardiopsis flavida]|uniref:Helix-turn-helix protein n=1 Tax=Murinocardiopsis flavida TaxID=645275 RepID=A0A2P8DKK9_9ACTN|nr:helix-turn-helix transcriptional regulator [Murinocardiopsis flavida]PSK97756.1 helix-turn-helix protein [Murinocardiopsis flavida]
MPADDSPDPAGTELAFGQRLKLLRTRRGMTREVLGGLVGRSGSWVKAVECGRLATPKLSLLLRLAEALRTRDLAQLTGCQSVDVDSSSPTSRHRTCCGGWPNAEWSPHRTSATPTPSASRPGS